MKLGKLPEIKEPRFDALEFDEDKSRQNSDGFSTLHFDDPLILNPSDHKSIVMVENEHDIILNLGFPLAFKYNSHKLYVLHFDGPPVYDVEDEGYMIVFYLDEIQTKECIKNKASWHLDTVDVYLRLVGEHEDWYFFG
jgi:hypothetical protein